MPRRLVFDIEGNGLLDTVTKVHCIEAVDPDTRECLSFGPDRIAEGLATLDTADQLIAHYGEGYDFRALEKVWRYRIPIPKRLDTVVVSRLMFPNIKEADKALVRRGVLPGKLSGKHSIEAWGMRLGRPKLHTGIEDWSEWTPQMQERCAGDAMTNVDLLLHLDSFNYPEAPVILEHRVARLLLMMEDAGVPFDEAEGAKLHVNLLAKRERIEEELVAEYGSWYEPKKRDEHGMPKEYTPKVSRKDLGYLVGATMTPIKRIVFNPRSNAHVIKEFKKLGWAPVAFTKGGEPELKDETLEAIAKEIPDARKLAEYRLLAKRLDMLADGDGAWLKKVTREGLIHGRYNPMGTPHSRASHFDPNVAQVPKVQKLYGKECRALFGAGHHKSGRFVQVGADMSGLQQRALGHYLTPLDDGVYGKLVVSEDIHWVYAQAATLVPEGAVRDKKDPLHEIIRDTGAKPFGYAYLFGCYPKKSGQVVRRCAINARHAGFPELYERFFGKGESDTKVGEKVRKEFDERLKLGALNKRLLHNYRLPGKWKKHITGLDGRKVPCRSEHSLLNYLLSSAEAIICKTWLCDVYDALIERGYKWGWDGDFVIILWVHDEIQVAARKGIEEEVAQVLKECGLAAGVKLGFRVPLDIGSKIGLTWADTH